LDRLNLDRWVGAAVRAGEEEVARARDFFAGHARHVEKLTRVKMEDRPDRAEEILRRRRCGFTNRALTEDEPSGS
jgi:hypothetical protein